MTLSTFFQSRGVFRSFGWTILDTCCTGRPRSSGMKRPLRRLLLGRAGRARGVLLASGREVLAPAVVLAVGGQTLSKIGGYRRWPPMTSLRGSDRFGMRRGGLVLRPRPGAGDGQARFRQRGRQARRASTATPVNPPGASKAFYLPSTPTGSSKIKATLSCQGHRHHSYSGPAIPTAKARQWLLPHPAGRLTAATIPASS